MKVVKVCLAVAILVLAGYAQVSPLDSNKARVLENAWNEAEKNKDAKAIEDRPDQIVNDSMRLEAYEHAVVRAGLGGCPRIY